MKISVKPISTTIIGGLVFLVPVIIVVVIVGKAFQLMGMLARPLSRWVPVDSIGGIAVANLITIVGLLLLCFVAGLLARSTFGGKVSVSLESKLHAVFPKYAFIKSMTEALGGSDKEKTLKPVLVKFDDYSQIVFEIEREGGVVAVYLPGAPDPWSGSVVHVPQERVEALDVEFLAVIKSMTRVGLASSKMLSARNPHEQKQEGL
jgi:uncharacterized membrane protein